MDSFTQDERNEIETEIRNKKWNKKESNVFKASLIEARKRNTVRDRLKNKLLYKSLSFQEKINYNEKKN